MSVTLKVALTSSRNFASLRAVRCSIRFYFSGAQVNREILSKGDNFPDFPAKRNVPFGRMG